MSDSSTKPSANELWRTEGRIFGYMLISCILCAVAGYALGVRGGVLDVKVMYIVLWCLLFITAYAMSIGTFIKKENMSKDMLALLALMWACYALAGYTVWRG